MSQPYINIDQMLEGRESRYGSFEGHAKISQSLKRAMHDSPNWGKLTDVQKEGLEMVQHKIARMLNGDPGYLDNIVDIVGYSTLVKDVMESLDKHVKMKQNQLNKEIKSLRKRKNFSSVKNLIDSSTVKKVV